MDLRLTGKAAIVTGSSRGIGKAIATGLVAEGCRVTLCARDAEVLEQTAVELRATGAKVLAIAADIGKPEDPNRVVEETVRTFGRIDILVNNAGCNVRKPALEVTWDDWNLILDTNLRGTFFVSQAVARHMVPRKYGRIINIGSVTCVAGYAGLGPYGASRGGVKQLTMSLADDWGVHCITVNCLAPGWFRTEQTKALYENQEWVDYLVDRIPAKRPGEPHDLDGAVVFLASESSRYVNGQTLLVDGGISVGSTRATAAPKKQT